MRHSFCKFAAALFAAFSASHGIANAATSIYTDSSNFGGWPNAVNAGASIGGEDAASATIPNGGWIAYSVAPSFTTVSTRMVFTNVTGANTALFYVGRTNGSGWFSALNNIQVTLTNGVNEITSGALTNYCEGLGGCDVVIFQAWNGSTFAVDSVIARTPEPSVWALMILGFAGVGWRLKKARSRRAVADADFGGAFA